MNRDVDKLIDLVLVYCPATHVTWIWHKKAKSKKAEIESGDSQSVRSVFMGLSSHDPCPSSDKKINIVNDGHDSSQTQVCNQIDRPVVRLLQNISLNLTDLFFCHPECKHFLSNISPSVMSYFDSHYKKTFWKPVAKNGFEFIV